MCWLPPRNTTDSTPTRFSGLGPTRRCGSGSPSTPPEFVASILSRNTRAACSPSLLTPDPSKRFLDQRPDRVPGDGPLDVALLLEVEHEDRQLAVAAGGDRLHVHELQV